MFGWLRRLLRLDDKDFSPFLIFGRCQAVLGYRYDMMVTCGIRTNKTNGRVWYCSRHLPEVMR